MIRRPPRSTQSRSSAASDVYKRQPLHHRMPVIVPNGYEEQWTEQVKDADELRGLFAIMMSWSPDGWLVEDVNKKETDQMSLF